MGVPATTELTDFLAGLADRPDGPAARHAAVECAARALHADVAVLLIDGGVVAVVGLPAERVPAFAVAEVAAVAFTAEEVCLLRGMAGVLELSLQALHVIESERRHAKENDRLVGSLRERQRLLEQLSAIQRAIARRAPLDQILQAVTSGARELLNVEMAGLNLIETDDRTLGSMVACDGVAPEVLARLKRIPLVAGGVSGLAVMGDELVYVEDYGNSPIAVPEMAKASLKSAMAVPVHENGDVVGSLVVGSYSARREWDKDSQEILEVFAEHVSLALTDAQTLEAMNQAFHDSLTGLASRALFLTRMESAFAATGAGRGVAALFVDLDRFKVVNDSLGHAAGDQLLVGVADRITACLRGGDTAARLGGDEFAVLLPGVGALGEVVPVARRILEAMREPFDLGGKETYVSCSIGIAYAGAGAQDAPELMVHADLAMYQAKKNGKDRYEVFEPAMQATFEAGLAMEADLRRWCGTSSNCATSRSCTCGPGRSPGWRRWSAGSTRSGASSRRWSSSRWPRRPA
jgi:diguanylate cyclase (GGDEF)-like protein